MKGRTGLLIAAWLGLSTSGYASLNSSLVSDEKLQERAAFALGVDPASIVISNRGSEGVRINFTATVGGKANQCYVTHAVSVAGSQVSDALCSGARASKGAAQGKSKDPGSCNALLRSAGRC